MIVSFSKVALSRESTFLLIVLLLSLNSCKQVSINLEGNLCEEDLSYLKNWDWENTYIPPYSWPLGTAFAKGLYVDVAFDSLGVAVKDNKIVFSLNPLLPIPPTNPESKFNYRSEIRTAPWNIEHPLGTEQWIGWSYTFSQDYKINLSEPITIYQNHPGIMGESPQFELEIAGKDRPRPAKGGEIQIVNNAMGTRDIRSFTPQAGETYIFVVHLIYGFMEDGYLQVWINDQIVYDKRVSTAFSTYPWGGNNKWGLYHHSHNGDSMAVKNTLDQNISQVEIRMGPLKLLTRAPDYSTYLKDAYNLVRPDL